MRLKVSSAKLRLFCLGLYVLIYPYFAALLHWHWVDCMVIQMPVNPKEYNLKNMVAQVTVK